MDSARPWLFLFSARKYDIAVFLCPEMRKILFLQGYPFVDKVLEPLFSDALFKAAELFYGIDIHEDRQVIERKKKQVMGIGAFDKDDFL